jgi:hypothetical protein
MFRLMFSRVELVGGRRAHWPDPNLINAVATPVLQNALRYFQTLSPRASPGGTALTSRGFSKAQRIEVLEKRYDDHVSEYQVQGFVARSRRDRVRR